MVINMTRLTTYIRFWVKLFQRTWLRMVGKRHWWMGQVQRLPRPDHPRWCERSGLSRWTLGRQQQHTIGGVYRGMVKPSTKSTQRQRTAWSRSEFSGSYARACDSHASIPRTGISLDQTNGRCCPQAIDSGGQCVAPELSRMAEIWPKKQENIISRFGGDEGVPFHAISEKRCLEPIKLNLCCGPTLLP